MFIVLPTSTCLLLIFQVMLHLPYSRFLEDEADRVGLEIAAKVFKA
jgi:Zn-dependent protease with chaperone function